MLSLKHRVEYLAQDRFLKTIPLLQSLPFPFLPVEGRWLIILYSSVLAVYCLLCNTDVPFTRGRIYFSAPLMLGLATWFDSGWAMWLALASGILADRTWVEARNVFLWLSSFTCTPTFYHENNMPQKAAGPRRVRDVEEPWAQPAARRGGQLSPASFS